MTTQERTQLRITKWRTKNKLSYAKAAKVVGISSGVLHKIETGKLRVTGDTAQRLAPVLGVAKWWTLVTPLEAKSKEQS